MDTAQKLSFKRYPSYAVPNAITDRKPKINMWTACRLTIWTIPFHSPLQPLPLFPGCEKLLVIEAHLSFCRLQFSSRLLTGRMVWETFSNSEGIRPFTPFSFMSVNVCQQQVTKHTSRTLDMHAWSQIDQIENKFEVTWGWRRICRKYSKVLHSDLPHQRHRPEEVKREKCDNFISALLLCSSRKGRLSTPSIYTLLPFGVHW